MFLKLPKWVDYISRQSWRDVSCGAVGWQVLTSTRDNHWLNKVENDIFKKVSVTKCVLPSLEQMTSKNKTLFIKWNVIAVCQNWEISMGIAYLSLCPCNLWKLSMESGKTDNFFKNGLMSLTVLFKTSLWEV